MEYPPPVKGTLEIGSTFEDADFPDFAMKLQSIEDDGDDEDRWVEMLITSSTNFELESKDRHFCLDFPDNTKLPGKITVASRSRPGHISFPLPRAEFQISFSMDAGELDPETELFRVEHGHEEYPSVILSFSNATPSGIDYAFTFIDQSTLA